MEDTQDGVDRKEVSSCVRLARIREKSLGSDVSKEGVAMVSWVGMMASAIAPVFVKGMVKQSLSLGVLALTATGLLAADPVSREIRERSRKDFDAEAAADRCVRKIRSKHDREASEEVPAKVAP